jgi:D-beta-D-heptose 7-phosphate kinase/D-beta-D-heptose 1-phosphate adenosyltransferase
LGDKLVTYPDLKKIAVVGDICEDVYVYGDCPRLCPDGPVPVFEPYRTIVNEGMAGNVFENMNALNNGTFKVDLWGTGTFDRCLKTRYVDEKTNQLLVRVDDIMEPTRIHKESLNEIVEEDYEAIVISDYNKGFLEEEDITFLSWRAPVFLDTKKVIGNWARNCRFIKLNEFEYAHNFKPFNIESEWAEQLIVTSGSAGCRWMDIHFPVDLVEVKDNTGAGDTWIAAFTLKLMKGSPTPEAIKFANRAASDVVQRRGVVTVKGLTV